MVVHDHSPATSEGELYIQGQTGLEGTTQPSRTERRMEGATVPAHVRLKQFHLYAFEAACCGILADDVSHVFLLWNVCLMMQTCVAFFYTAFV